MKKLLYFFLIGILSCSSTSLLAQKTDNSEDKPVYSVEQMPQYPEGEEALLKFIKENLKYPKEAAQGGVEGKVVIRFVVNREGVVTDVTVIRSLNAVCDQEAMRVVKMMPTWTPGKSNGRNIPVYYSLPVVYKLNKGTSDVKTPHLIVDGTSQPYSMLKDTLLLKPANIESITELKDSAAIAVYGSLGKNGVIIVRTKAAEARLDSTIKADKPVYGVEVMPQYPGGENALMEFISNNLHYPMSDAEKGTQGRVTIRFVVTKTGKVTDATVIRGLSPGCDAEAVRVINKMPTWKPGYQKGKPVSVYYTLPIVYKLQK